MKTIGLIGGLSAESTIEYYRLMNRIVKERRGEYAQPKIILYSVDREEILRLKADGNWDEIASHLSDKARILENAGCDMVLLCTNTMHKVADRIAESITIPFLHILDATAGSIVQSGIKKVGFIGTSVTMNDGFYLHRLRDNYGLEIVLPPETEHEQINHVIYNELCIGQIKDSSREYYRKVINRLIANGAEGIILGCTEITLLIKPEHSRVPIFDTTTIHAQVAIDSSLQS